jgi:hypothetical protein
MLSMLHQLFEWNRIVDHDSAGAVHNLFQHRRRSEPDP